MKKAIMTVIVLVVIGWIWLFPRHETEEPVDVGPTYPKMFVVDITGAVSLPGKYVFFEPVTVEGALSMGGMMLPDADISGIVFSQVIRENRVIHIPSTQVEQTKPAILVNVNKAGFKELITIPSMTETRAASLIVYREAHGAFKSVDELIHVKHIGIATLEKIRPFVTVG